ncbi:MAG TPA: hypothetical protein VHK06_02590 [Candidatus Limnocylindria bacterium]|nr:hypothetical protein [Candidatus Limnocylindria bacterium]
MYSSRNAAPLEEPADPLSGVTGHGVWQMAAILLPGLYTVVLVAYLLRTLGPAGYAPWAIAAAVVGWLALLDAGLSITTTRDAARAVAGDRDAVARVLTANGAYGVLGGVAVTSGVLIALVIPLILRLGGAEAVQAWLVGALLTLDLGIVLATAGWAGTVRGMRRFDIQLAVNVVQVAVAGALVVALLPRFGLVGAAVAQPAGRLGARALLGVLLWRQLPWFRARPRVPRMSELRVVGAFSLPLMAWHVAREIGIGTDLIIVGAAAGATEVGLFAAGSQLIRYVGLFLFPAVAVLLPSFAAAGYTRPELVPALLRRGVFLAAFVGASVYGGFALQATAVLELWSGQASELSTQVLILYAITWALITPPYVMALMLVAQGRHRLFGMVVVVEALVNLTVSIILVQLIGPIGVALATAIVMTADWIVVVPLLTARELHIPLQPMLAAAGLGLASGAALIAVINTVPVGGLAGLVVRGALGAVALGVSLTIGVRASRKMASLRRSPSA